MIKIIILILISSLIGYITNFLAIKMLFKPYKPIKILHFNLQGLIPKRKHKLIENIADIIEKELLTTDDLLSLFNSQAMEEELDSLLSNIINIKLKTYLVTEFPMITLILNDELLNKIKNIVIVEILNNKDEIFNKLVNNKNFIKNLIINKMNLFSLKKLETLTFELAKTELKHIEIIGAILGALIGTIQVLILLING